MINSVVGLMNSGKTLYMTYKLYIAYCSGKTIITNYDLNFPHYKINLDWLKSLASNDETVLDNVAMGFDELWLWMDSRSSGANKVGTYFFLQSSKDDTEIYMTSQHNGQLDIRLRNNMHKISQCSRVLKINGKYVEIDEENRFLPEKYRPHLYIIYPLKMYKIM